MNKRQANRSLTSISLLAAAVMPLLYFGTQIAAAPFYPGYSFSLLSVSMLGTHFSRHPWIFNAGELLIGFATLVGALGLYRSYRPRTHLLITWLIVLSMVSTGVMTLKAGIFPMPDPRHNSWGLLFNLTILIPFLMLIGLLKQHHCAGLKAYLTFSVALLLLLIPFTPRLGYGTLQRLIAVGTLVPVGVIGFFFWRELNQGLPDQSDSKMSP